jgi:hypothetical protein
MDTKTFYSLIDKFLEGAATQEEKALLDDYTNELAEIGGLTRSQEEKARLKKRLYQNILKGRMASRTKVVPFYQASLFKVAAAAIVIFMALGAYFILNKNKDVKPVAKEGVQKDVLPGHDGAVLTLADGRTIILDNAQDGKITDVAVKNGNKVSYQNSAPTKVEYNTMATPKGRQFSLVLPDGTEVWLNAASSITYPTAFVGGDRKVQITGEVYFEVAHDASKPFHVTVNGMDVQVLGTHFNINSYGDGGDIKTTLLQGRIKVTIAGKTEVIKPGQQAQVANNNIKLISDADVDAVMAWKNGFFSFEKTDIKGLMRQVSRWYDVEVVYQDIPNETFTGKIDRNLTLTQLLNGLAETKVHYRIEEGKKLIILP